MARHGALARKQQVGLLPPGGVDARPLHLSRHSPLLASLPGARLLEVGDWGIRETTYDDLELVGHWRRYLEDPKRYLRHVID